MKKITCNFFVILLTIVFIPLLSVSQVKPDLDNQDSLIHYLKMDQHPVYSEAPAFVMQKTLEQQFNSYTTDIKLELILKVFKAQDIKAYIDLVVPDFFENTKLKGLKVVIYSLENGQVKKAELNRKSISETVSGEQSIKLTGTSDVKDGSIIHYQLSSNSEGFIPGFNFQEGLPVAYAAFKLKLLHTPKIRTEENVKIPFKKFTDKNTFYKSKLPAVSVIYPEDDYIVHSWIRRSLPPLEIFNSNQKKENLAFSFPVNADLEKSRKESEERLNKMTWKKYNTMLYTGKYSCAFEANDYLRELLPSIIKKETDSITIALKLFKYVQENYSVRSFDRVLHFEIIAEEKRATPAALNLLLCALYRHAGFHSDLVYVSTDRKNLLVPDKVREKNTAIAVRVILNGLSYFCYPAQKKLPFGYLPYNYYNGYTRLINKTGGELTLSPEMTKNKYDVIVDLSPIDTDKNKFKLNISSNFGVYGSVEERTNFAWDSITFKSDYKKQIERLNPGLRINNYNVKVKNLNNIDTPFIVTAEADIELGNSSDQLFLDPFLEKVFNGKNPFEPVKERRTDITMNHCYQINYTFRFRLSDDITVEKLPVKTSFQYSSPATIKYVQEANYNAAAKMVEVQYNYDIIPGSYDREEISDLNTFYTEIMKALNQKLLLKKK